MGVRALALRAGIRLEVVSLAWMAAEAILAIGAGIAARSVLLTAFGFDSVIELLSASTLLWRLTAESRGHGSKRMEGIEHRAAWISAVLLILLSVYVVGTSAAGLLLRLRPEASLIGLAVSGAAVIIMPLLALGKKRANVEIQSGALRADIAETLTCAYMAATTLVGVGLNAAFGWWWAEYLAALVLLVWLVGEAREALESARGEADE
jgi:divalent metal cation (Fe/Co/Zn/Cd) transporter